jgi:hypothetical protein
MIQPCSQNIHSLRWVHSALFSTGWPARLLAHGHMKPAFHALCVLPLEVQLAVVVADVHV